MIVMTIRSTISTLLLVVCHSVTGDDVGVPERSAGDYLHLSCRINSTSEEQEQEQEEQEGRGVHMTLGRGGQAKGMNRVMTSPNYPRNYPNRSECLEVIRAPRGHRIRLYFGDDFHLESSNDCDFDYVELRDGPFGYSPLLGRYCGSHRPPITETTGRYLWVRFQADEYIEYKGFQAVYEFFELDSEGKNRTSSVYSQGVDLRQSDDEVCRIKVDTSRHEGILSHLDIAPAYLNQSNQSAAPIDCTWLVYSPPTNRIYLRWMSYQMPPSSRVCQDSYLSVYERTTAESDRRRAFCGAIARDLQLTSNRVYLRMFSKTRSLMPAFRIIFTVFKNGPCPTWLFHCGDNTCINKSLVCNDQVNCNYSLDEAICRPTTETSSATSVPISTSVQTLAVAMVTGAIVTIVVVVCLVGCRQRHVERRLRRHALKQDARHAEGADLLGLATPFDRSTHPKTCQPTDPDAARDPDLHGERLLQPPRGSDHQNPISRTDDSEPHLFDVRGSNAIASSLEGGGGTEIQGTISDLEGPGFYRPTTDSGWSKSQTTKSNCSVYEKTSQRAWTAPYAELGERWPPSGDGCPPFPSEFTPFVTDDGGVGDRDRSVVVSGVRLKADEDMAGAEVSRGHAGSRALPLCRYYDDLRKEDSSSLPRTASGPDVIVGNRSRGTWKWNQTLRDRDIVLEPITVAGETTFPVHPEVTSAARLRESSPGGAPLELLRESARANCELGMLRSNTTFTSDASGVGHVVSRRRLVSDDRMKAKDVNRSSVERKTEHGSLGNTERKC